MFAADLDGPIIPGMLISAGVAVLGDSATLARG